MHLLQRAGRPPACGQCHANPKLLAGTAQALQHRQGQKGGVRGVLNH